MKIQGTQRAPKLNVTGGESKAKGSKAKQATHDPAAKVSLSNDAAFVGGLLADVGNVDEVRVDVVEEARAALNNGTLEQSVDMDKVVDSLMADL